VVSPTVVDKASGMPASVSSHFLVFVSTHARIAQSAAMALLNLNLRDYLRRRYASIDSKGRDKKGVAHKIRGTVPLTVPTVWIVRTLG
jgi:hypothetical protein